MNIWAFVGTFLLGLCGAAGPVLLKVGSRYEGLTKLVYIGFAMGTYVLGFAVLTWVVKQAPLSVLVPLWYAQLIVMVAVIGFWVFGETFPPLKLLGYGLLLVALAVLYAAEVRPS